MENGEWRMVGGLGVYDLRLKSQEAGIGKQEPRLKSLLLIAYSLMQNREWRMENGEWWVDLGFVIYD